MKISERANNLIIKTGKKSGEKEAGKLFEALRDFNDGPCSRAVIDLSASEALSSATLSVIFSASALLGERLALAGPKEDFTRLLRNLGIREGLNIYTVVKNAIMTR